MFGCPLPSLLPRAMKRSGRPFASRSVKIPPGEGMSAPLSRFAGAEDGDPRDAAYAADLAAGVEEDVEELECYILRRGSDGIGAGSAPCARPRLHSRAGGAQLRVCARSSGRDRALVVPWARRSGQHPGQHAGPPCASCQPRPSTVSRLKLGNKAATWSEPSSSVRPS